VVNGESLLRDAERTADRLRVVLPRLLGRADDAPGVALLAEVRDTLQALADAAAPAQGRTRREVPRIGVHAVPEQLLVLAHDLVSATARPGAFAGEAAAQAAHEQALDDARVALQGLRSRL
jgi:hypothetical protein